MPDKTLRTIPLPDGRSVAVDPDKTARLTNVGPDNETIWFTCDPVVIKLLQGQYPDLIGADINGICFSTEERK